MLEGGFLELVLLEYGRLFRGMGRANQSQLTIAHPHVFSPTHMQGGPASEVKVLLSENQPLTAKEGAP